jgi:hypothetical protein
MIRKIIVFSAATLAIGALTVAPRVGAADPTSASVAVSAAVAYSASISADTAASTTTWTGAAAQPLNFNVSVLTNDPGGVKFTFNSATNPGSFKLTNGSNSSQYVSYSVSGAYGDTYNPGGAGTTYVIPIGQWNAYVFTVGLPGGYTAGVPAGTYSDSLTVAVSPLG